MPRDTYQKLSITTVALHWIVAAFMIGLLASGIYMEENEAYGLYDWHKSFGVLLVVFALWRIVWRLMNGWPKFAGNYSAATRFAAHAVHWLLILGTVLMPISGFLMSGLGGHGIPFFGMELMASNPDPANPGKVIALNGDLAKLGHTMHGLGGNLILAALALHIVGALKHHIIDKDGTLLRMKGKEI